MEHVSRYRDFVREPGWRAPVLRIPMDVVEGSGNRAFLL